MQPQPDPLLSILLDPLTILTVIVYTVVCFQFGATYARAQARETIEMLRANLAEANSDPADFWKRGVVDEVEEAEENE